MKENRLLRFGIVRLAAAATFAAAACSSTPTSPTSAAPSSTVTTAATGDGGAPSVQMTIGAQGGSLSINGATLTIPSGALSADPMVTMTSVPAESQAQAYSNVSLFEPSGLTFAMPPTILI